MEQILDQAERTEKAAYKSSDQGADKDQKADDIVCHLEIPAADDGLERSDRTGADCARAGVAVQTRNTDIFQFAGVDFSGEKSGDMAVCKKRPESLDRVALPFIYFERCFFGAAFFIVFHAASAAGSTCIGITGVLISFVIQFLYTPYKY